MKIKFKGGLFLVQVVKRDGRIVEFDKDKIKNAIKKAFKEVDGYLDLSSVAIIDRISNQISNCGKLVMTVEEIQDLVESLLMETNRHDVAKAYIIYRNERHKAREQNSSFMKNVSEKLFAKNVENQNANVDEKSFGGRVGAASSELMKKYALDYIVSPMAKKITLTMKFTFTT